ncbi:MAG: trypsin-like peptidase domain-containing protein [Verrucomicrobiota bacterium]
MNSIKLFAFGALFLIQSWMPLGAITPQEEPVVLAVQKAMPAVVSVYLEGEVEYRSRDPYSRLLEDFYGRRFVYREPVKSLGSGAIVSPEGFILTCAHVVEIATEIKAQIHVVLADERKVEAKLVYIDSDMDLALLKIEDKKPFPFLDVKALSPNLIGQTVIALGNPVGYQNSISAGILSAKNRSLKVENQSYEGLLQTDAAINPGNSGGPSVDIQGNFVGVNSAKASGQAIEGIGFIIPSNKASGWAVDAIAIAKGEKKAPTPPSAADVLKKHFGFTLQELTPDVAKTLGIPVTEGVIVSEVEEGSPAAKVELKPGMLITGLGGIVIQGMDDLPKNLHKLKSGNTLSIQITLFRKTQNGGVLRRSVSAAMTAR